MRKVLLLLILPLLLCSCGQADFNDPSRVLVYAEDEEIHLFDQSVGEAERWYIQDHCIVRGEDGWHLFGITNRQTTPPEPDPQNEQNFSHAVGGGLLSGMWDKQPYALTADLEAYGERFLWAPFVIKKADTYYMYYCVGGASPQTFEIHLATSKDLYDWQRYEGNPVVVDGYDARDPMVFKDGGRYIMYYTATTEKTGGKHCVKAVVSDDLYHWTDEQIVYEDMKTGTMAGNTESPYVIKVRGYYFLFIGPRTTVDSTEVFVSDDPLYFEQESKCGFIKSRASEIIEHDGKYYITDCGWWRDGVYISELHFGELP